MLMCEQILGTIDDARFQGKSIDYVDIEWHEALMKIQRKTTYGGAEVGIHLNQENISRGLRQGDVLYEEGDNVVVVNIPSCDAIEIRVANSHHDMVSKICEEIASHHATLFRGADERTFITPYSELTLHMLTRFHGVSAVVRKMQLHADRRISSGLIVGHTEKS